MHYASPNNRQSPFKTRSYPDELGGCRGRECMVVGFTTTCAMSAYHH
jgi:hypothetical protein